MAMDSPLDCASPTRWRPAQAALSLMVVGALLGLPLLRTAPTDWCRAKQFLFLR